MVGALNPLYPSKSKSFNTLLVNLKTMVSASTKALKNSKYFETYIDAFAYRFNRRLDLRDLIGRLIGDDARNKPVPKKVSREAGIIRQVSYQTLLLRITLQKFMILVLY